MRTLSFVSDTPYSLAKKGVPQKEIIARQKRLLLVGKSLWGYTSWAASVGAPVVPDDPTTVINIHALSNPAQPKFPPASWDNAPFDYKNVSYEPISLPQPHGLDMGKPDDGSSGYVIHQRKYVPINARLGVEADFNWEEYLKYAKPAQATAIELYYKEHLTIPAIAEKLRISKPAVSQRIILGIKSMQKAINAAAS